MLKSLTLTLLLFATLVVACGDEPQPALTVIEPTASPASAVTAIPSPSTSGRTEAVLAKYATTVPLPHATPTDTPFSVVQSPTVNPLTEAVLAKYPTTVPLLSATPESHTYPTATPTVTMQPTEVHPSALPTQSPPPVSTAPQTTSTPTIEPTLTATPTIEPTPTATPTIEPTPTAIPVVNLVLDINSFVEGYRSDGTADVTLDFTLLNEGDLPHATAQNVSLSCRPDTSALSGCGEAVSLVLQDGYGPAGGSFALRLPMGVHRVELAYGGREHLVANVDVPERILGVERDLFSCYADREHAQDPNDSYAYGCGGWSNPTVEKWLNDVPIKVWATGDPRYIEDFRTVLGTLSPVLDLDFAWVDSERQADLRGYVGVHREDIYELGFQPSSVHWGGFAGINTDGGEATRGYAVVWYDKETPSTVVTLHEAVHALLAISHSTRPLSIVGGSNMALLSPRDEALFRLHYHPLVRPGMTMQQVEELVVFRDELLDSPTPEPITDPMQMVWRALVSLDEAGTVGYNLSGGRTNRQCTETFGVRRGPLPFKLGRFSLWKDDPALLYFHDHRSEVWIHYSLPNSEWQHHVRPLTGGEWKSINLSELNDLTDWWVWNGKLHRALRSIVQDASSEDIIVDTTDDGNVSLHVTMDESYVHLGIWGEGWRVKSVDFTMTLNPQTFSIEGYKWVVQDDPPANYPDYPCLTYEEVATDFVLGFDLELPGEIPE